MDPLYARLCLCCLFYYRQKIMIFFSLSLVFYYGRDLAIIIKKIRFKRRLIFFRVCLVLARYTAFIPHDLSGNLLFLKKKILQGTSSQRNRVGWSYSGHVLNNLFPTSCPQGFSTGFCFAFRFVLLPSETDQLHCALKTPRGLSLMFVLEILFIV